MEFQLASLLPDSDTGSQVDRFRLFEMRVLRTLGDSVLSDADFAILAEVPLASLEWTGTGYFATSIDPRLPLYGNMQSAPMIVGTADDLCVGFIAYVGNHEVTLECHAWGEQAVPQRFRDRDVQLSIHGPAN